METKPGQAKKGKKVWKGEKRGGPAPARHIPWPEIFKHHISVVEGHLRMMEMIQKHTVEGTGNYETITTIVKRSKEMLYQTKDATRSFIPPKNQREEVPLGSSSYSMYPGYSPEDVEYGKAAGEAGQALGELKKQGIKRDGPANGAEYQVGQAHGAKRKMLFRKDAADGAGSESAAQANSPANTSSEEPAQDAGGENQYFVIDTIPTLVSLPTAEHKPSKKRALEADAEGSGKKKSKKSKKEPEVVVVETDDITAEVEASLKAKDEKAKAREERKRRRSSGDDDAEKVTKKSKKEKSKKRDAASGAESNDDGEGKKKKKSKD